MSERSKTQPRRRWLREGLLPTDVVNMALRPTGEALLRARQLARSGELEEIRSAVRADPALCVATLRHAYKHQHEQTKDSTDVGHIVTRLGVNAMRDVMQQLHKLEPLEQESEHAVVVRDHSVRVAAVAGQLSAQLGRADSSRVHLTALLHDVGKLLAIQAGELTYLDVPARFDQPDLLNVYERRTIGYDHARLGWHALSAWGLPEPIPTVVAWHHQGSRAYSMGGETAQLVAIVRAADMLERLLESTPELEDADLWKLDRNLACRRLELAPDMLRRQWPALQKTWADAVPAAPTRAGYRQAMR